MKKIYNVCIDSNNSTEAFNVIWSVCNDYGDVMNIRRVDSVPVDIFMVKTTKRRFKKMLKIFEASGNKMNNVGNYWFL